MNVNDIANKCREITGTANTATTPNPSSATSARNEQVQLAISKAAWPLIEALAAASDLVVQLKAEAGEYHPRTISARASLEQLEAGVESLRLAMKAIRS